MAEGWSETLHWRVRNSVCLSICRVCLHSCTPRHFDVNIVCLFPSPPGISCESYCGLTSCKVTLTIHMTLISQLHCSVVASSQCCFDLLLRYEASITLQSFMLFKTYEMIMFIWSLFCWFNSMCFNTNCVLEVGCCKDDIHLLMNQPPYFLDAHLIWPLVQTKKYSDYYHFKFSC